MTAMKTIIKSSIVLCVFMILTSFSLTKDNLKGTCIFNETLPELLTTSDDVIITYEKPDVCNLNYLGEIKVTENFLFYNNNGLKKNTLAELKKQAFEKSGTIVYVYTDLQNGFGIGFTRTIFACVFKE